MSESISFPVSLLVALASGIGAWIAVRVELAISRQRSEDAIKLAQTAYDHADEAHEKVSAHVERFHTTKG